MTAPARQRTLASSLESRIVMVASVLILTLLTLAASLASWLFAQWLAPRMRTSGAALAIGGSGTLLLIGSVAFVVIAAIAWSQKLIPVADLAMLIAPATHTSQGVTVQTQKHPALQALPSDEKKERMAAAERHLELSEYAAAIDVARTYLTGHPGDTEMKSILARSQFAAQYPGVLQVFPQWPATGCVTSTRSDKSQLWLLENKCAGAVAVLFASCQSYETGCLSRSLTATVWSYEPAGILMTASDDRPVALRLGRGGPLVAPIFTIRDAAGSGRQIRYLACDVSAPGVLSVLHDLQGEELTEQRLTAELRVDACYTQVLDWSRSGQLYGKSPDRLLRDGID